MENTDPDAAGTSPNIPLIEAEADGARAKRIRLKSTTDLDGRTVAAREARALARAIEADLGGDLTAIQATLVDRFVALTAWCVSQDVAASKGEAFEVERYSAVANTLKRIGETLGLKLQPRDVGPTLGQILTGRG